MPDDLTVLISTPPPVRVRVQQGNTWSQERQFSDAFRIGRSPDCDVCLPERVVSKVHVEVRIESGQWWIVDLQSANKTYVNGRRIDRLALSASAKLELGLGGPVVWLTVGEHTEFSDATGQAPSKEDSPASVTEIVNRLQGRPQPEEEGEQTRVLREALKRIKKQHSLPYKAVIGVVALLLVGAVSLAIYQSRKIDELRETAGDIFYAMKQVELQLAQLEEVVVSTAQSKQMAEILAKRQKIKELETRYDRFLADLGIYRQGMSEQDRAVFHVARLFGECEATMPKEFLAEVNKYIQKWKTTSRLSVGVRRASQNGFVPVVASSLWGRNLPPQFFYLALQESGFDAQAVGPKTKMGYAKGIWQFIPTTAEEYGLRPGPLKHLGQYDPQDERYHFEKATEAAARYLKRLYTTDAQASGLLVIASYNWGEGNVIRIIRQMPENPKDRNFWQLLKHHKIPQETYDYVFYIISAAVIGENPRLFGFEFTNPFPHAR